MASRHNGKGAIGSPPTPVRGIPAETSALSPGRRRGFPLFGLSAAAALLLFSVSASAHELRWDRNELEQLRHIHDSSLCPEGQYWYWGTCYDNEVGADTSPLPHPHDAAREAAKPSVQSVDVISTPVRDATYGVGEWIRVRVTFDKSITVQGSPTLKLRIGSLGLARPFVDPESSRVVRTVHIERTATRDTTTRNDNPDRAIIFSYRVRADDRDSDGITIRNDALSGGSIQGDFTYRVRVPTPGGSLGFDTPAGAETESPPPPPESTITYREVGPDGMEREGGAGEEERSAEPPPPAPQPGVARQSAPGSREVTEKVDAYTDLGANAITDDADHKVDGRKRRVPTFGSKTAGPFRFASGSAVSQALPAADGGDGTVTYTIERPGTPNVGATLPCGLTFTGSGRLLAAASTATGRLHPADCSSRNVRYTLVATDVDGDRATLDFVVAIGTELTFGDLAGPTLTVRTTHPVNAALPAAEGGDGRVTYSLDAAPALPANLGYVAPGATETGGGAITGTPTAAHSRTTYRLTATDRDGDTATLDFTIEVTSNRTPSFASATTHARRYLVGQPVFAALPAATGGDGRLAYTIDPALPRGLSLDYGNTIVGSPTGTSTETTYTLTARDADGDSATLTFPLAVASATAPKVTSVSITSRPSRGGDTYAAGDAIVVRIGFDRLVVAGGTPRLVLGIGTATRAAALTSSAPRSLDFRYTVVAGDRDADGIGVAAHALELAGGSVRGTDGVHAHLDLGSHAFANAAAHKVDGSLGAVPAGPAVSGVRIDSSPRDGNAYRAGESIQITVTFAADVTGSTPGLALGIGAETRKATPFASTARARYFKYQVAAGDKDTDGISVGADALRMYGATLRGTGGGAAQLGLGSHAITDAACHRVDGRGTTTRPSFSGASAVALRYTAGTAVDQALPSSAGSGTLTYRLGATPALPAGLSYVAPGATVRAGVTATGGGAIAGTPTTALARTTYTLTATDADGFTARFDFTITGTDAVPTFGSASVAAQRYTKDVAIATVNLPAATGGNGTLGYALGAIPALPDGLRYSAPGEEVGSGVTATGGGAIAGTPTAARPRATYTLIATDADGDEGRLTFTIVVAGDVPAFGTATVADQVHVADSPVELALPAATGGNGTLGYALGSTPALPAGLRYYAPGATIGPGKVATGGGAIAGTPTAAKATYTLTAADGDGDTANLSFAVTVVANTAPSFSASPAAHRYATGSAVSPVLTLPAASGGNGTLSYRLGAPPALPAGLTYHAPGATVRAGVTATGGGAIAGTPTGEQAATTYTLTAHDADGDASASDAGTYPFTIETSRAAKVRSVQISPAWAAGDAAPFTTGEKIAVVVTFTRAVDGPGSSIALQLDGKTVTAAEDTPGGWDPEVLRYLYTVQADDFDGDGIGIGVTPFVGGSRIESNPGRVAADLNIAGQAFTNKLPYTVNDAKPGFGDASVAAQRYRKNVAVTSAGSGGTTRAYVALPATSGGDRFTGTDADRVRVTIGGRLTYALTPTLPPGLTYFAPGETIATGVTAPGGGAIAGTPVAVFSATAYTLSATDYDGDQATLTFSLAVSTGSAPTFGNARVTASSHRTHAPIAALTLPAATGGDPPLSYGVTPPLPAGLSHTAPAAGAGNGGALAGTPTAAAVATTYTLTATDADGDAATLPFVLTVLGRPRFTGAGVAAQRYATGTRVNVSLPAADPGDGATDYDVRPTLPDGLGFDRTTRRIAGTPTTVTAVTTYTLIAHAADADRSAADAGTRAFTVEVADGVPTFGAASVAAQHYTAGTAVAASTLPAAAGGDAPLSYGLGATPALPRGLTYTAPSARDAHGGTLAGTPSAAKAAATYTLTATDADGDAATLDFTMAVAAAAAPTVSRIDFGSTPGADGVYTAGEAVWVRVRFAGAAALAVTGRPRLALTIGAHARPATYSHTITRDAYLRYVVQRADVDRDGIDVVGNALSLNGGSIRQSGSTVDANLDLSSTVIGSCNCTVDGGGLAFTATVAPQRLTVNTAFRVTLPAAVGGSDTVTYRLDRTPALPRGLTFDATTRVLSGTPTQTGAETTHTLTAADGTDTATLAFRLSVIDRTPRPVFTRRAGAQRYRRNRAVQVTLPAATGGTGSPTYALRGPGAASTLTLPAGLTYAAPGTRLGRGASATKGGVIHGTPAAVAPAAAYTLTATDTAGRTATQTFPLSVVEENLGAPAFAGALDLLCFLKDSLVTATLPAATGGDGTLRYALRGPGAVSTLTLPAGLTYYAPGETVRPGVTATRGGTIAGTATALASKATYALTATDDTGDAATLTFEFAIVDNTRPTFMRGVAAQEYLRARPVSATLPAAIGGDGTLRYALTGPGAATTLRLPAGLTYVPPTGAPTGGTIAGTPSAVTPAATYTLTATDADGDADTRSFTLAVADDTAPAFASPTGSPHRHRAGVAVDAHLPRAAGGNGTLRYTLTGPGEAAALSLPDGLAFDAAGPRLHGTPAAPAAAGTYTLTVTDADANTAAGDADTLTFILTVAAAVDRVPTFGTARVAAQRYRVGTQVAVALPRATGGDGTLTYTLAPRPPAGLAFDAAGPRLHGTPATGAPAATYTLTAHDADANAGDAATLRFTVTVVPNAPAFGVPSAAQRYVRNTAVDAALPTATGGDGVLGYTLTGPGDSATPSLPNGLSFDAAGPRLHGTPTAVAAEAVYTLTVHDADADRSAADAATLAVPLSVAAPDAPGVIAAYFGEGGRDDYLYSLHPTTRSIGFSPPKRTIRYWVRFGKRVTVTGTPKLALDIGGVKRAASYHSTLHSQSAGSYVQFRYDVRAADSDGDGIDVAANALTLNGGTIRGADGVDADLRLTNISRCHYPGGGDCASVNIPGMLVSGARPSFSATGPALAAGVGAAFGYSLPAASGGNAPLRYSLAATPALPRGLAFDAATRRIHGTPEAAQAARTYSLTVTDADGSPASLSFTLAVAAQAPAVTAVTVDPPALGAPAFLTGQQIAVGITFSEAVTVTGAPRLALDVGGVTRQAAYTLGSGATQLIFTYRVQAADVDHDGLGLGVGALTLNGATIRAASRVNAVLGLGDHAFADAWNLRVNSGRNAPRFASAIAARTYRLGGAVDDTLPAAAGATEYALTGPGSAATLSLPDGLAFNPTTRAITGTPTAVRAAASYTLTAHDADGDRSRSDAAVQTFAIGVIRAPTFAAAAQTFVVTAGKRVGLTLPAARGGDGALGYDFAPDPPGGLSFDAGTRTLGGTPTATQAATTYTLTATDSDGDEATLAVSIRVLAAEAPTVTGLAFDPPVGGGDTFYGGGQIAATVTFGKAVTVTPSAGGGTPRLALTIGTATRQMRYLSKLDGARLVFTYRVQEADLDTDGLGVAHDALTLNGATIRAGALDADLDLGSHAFADRSTLKVNGRPRPVFGGTQAPLRFRQNVRDAFTLPAATGGDGALTYRLETTPALPGGLTYYAPGATVRTGVTATGGGAIAGTPTARASAATYTLTAHDADTDRSARDAATLTFGLAVAGGRQPRFPTPQGAQSYVVGAPVSAALLAAGGGDPPLDYTLDPVLPGGLSYTAPAAQDTHGGTIAGTPGAVAPAATYRLTATDADGDAARQTFALEVAADALPRFGRKSGPAQRYVVGSAATATLPAATGGNGTLGYALTGPGDAATLTLPRGLAFAAGTRQIFGTPAVVAATATYTLQVSDGDGDTAALTFPLTVEADARPTFDPATWTAQHYRTNTPVSVALPAAAGGNGTLRYALTPTDSATGLPALPAGLTYYAPGTEVDARTTAAGGGTLAGTPTGVAAERDYTLTATDVDGDATTLTFSVQVTADLTPAFAVSAGPAQQYRRAVTVGATLPAATGGDTTPTQGLTYSVDPALPAGLTLGDTAPTITGAPAAEQAVAPYTLAATDVDGDAATLPFTIAVAGNALPAFAAATGPATSFTVSTAGSATLSTATGGDGTLTYSLGATPALPGGLTYYAPGAALPDTSPPANATRGGVIAGTPTARASATTYTLTAGDADGDTATQTFTLTVADAVPTFGSRTISAKRYVVNTPVNDVLPSATGGDGTLAYTVAPGLPAGLSFTASPPTIAGTPTEAAVEATYTLTATDANGDRADVGFRLTVAGAPLVTAVDIESTPANADKAYRAGETIEVKVSFDSNLMHVFGNARAVIQAPFLSLRIGAQTRRGWSSPRI